jgi:hypothetical protein
MVPTRELRAGLLVLSHLLLCSPPRSARAGVSWFLDPLVLIYRGYVPRRRDMMLLMNSTCIRLLCLIILAAGTIGIIPVINKSPESIGWQSVRMNAYSMFQRGKRVRPTTSMCWNLRPVMLSERSISPIDRMTPSIRYRGRFSKRQRLRMEVAIICI